MRGSNKLMVVLNLLTILLSFPILVCGIWLRTRASNTECFKFLQWPLILIGITIMLTSFASSVGVCYRNSFLISLYLILMLFLLFLLVGFVAFAYAVTAKGSGREVQNRAYLEYYLQDYQGWLKKRVESDSYWRKIRFCVRDSKACKKMRRTHDGVPETPQMFYHRALIPIQSGCCKPPTECGYIYENETVWREGSEGVVMGTNPDCIRWSNEQHLLCYDCDSCKAGVLATLKKSWRKVSFINLIVSILLLIIYIIAYATYKNNSRRNNCQPCGETRMTKAQPK